MKTDLVKNSPLIGIYDKNKVQLKNYKGWMLPNIFKSLKDEKASLSKASVLADWSCIGKFHLRGKTAAKFADSLVAGASINIKIGTFTKSCYFKDYAQHRKKLCIFSS